MKTMMKIWKNMLCAAAIGVMAMGFTACTDDDDDKAPVDVPAAVETSFVQKYPDATTTEWSVKGGFYVADFHWKANQVEVEAWFTSAGEWFLSDNDYGRNVMFLPGDVNTAFAASAYGSWTIDDIHYYEYSDSTKDFYFIEVDKKGQPETDLYFVRTADGVKLNKVVQG